MIRRCILCPKGCALNIEQGVDTPHSPLMVTGNKCPKGIEYAQQEWFNPMRMLTTTVKTTDSKFPRIPVRTSGAIPKDQINEAMRVINTLTVALPVVVGDIILKNILNLGVDVVVTLTIGED